jgi:DNA-binding transcriptional ArsR family regulator
MMNKTTNEENSAERVEKLIEESELKKLCINQEEWNWKIKKVQGITKVNEMTDFLKLVANPIRLKILLILLERDWACNCEFEQAFQEHQTLISHHLRKLRKAKIVTYTKSGQWNFYRLEEQYKQPLIEMRTLLLKIAEK